MYYQIIGNYGPQNLVIADILKKSEIFFNHYEDENNNYVGNYTYNSFLEDYYRPFVKYDDVLFPYLENMDPGYYNELVSYIKSYSWNFKGSCNLLDMLVSEANSIYNRGTLIHVDYSYEDMSSEFMNLINSNYYNKYSNLIQKNLSDYNNSNWKTITINYHKFITEDKYKNIVYQTLNISSNININSIYIKYHDTFIKNITQNTINNIFNA